MGVCLRPAQDADSCCWTSHHNFHTSGQGQESQQGVQNCRPGQSCNQNNVGPNSGAQNNRGGNGGSQNGFDGGDSQNCMGSKCNQNNGAGSEGNGGTSSGGQKTLNCPTGSSVSSSCTGTHCVVACGNGKQVEMECPLEGVDTSTTNWPNGSSITTATCGEKFDPPACFPFCY